MYGWNGLAVPNVGVNPAFAGLQTAAAQGAQGFQAFAPQVMDPIKPMNLQPLGVSVPSINPMGAAPGAGGWMGIQGLGANLETAKLGLGAVGAAAGLWSAFQQNKLAKATFNHQRGLLDTNLANSIKSYNLSLDDKLRSRQVVEGTSDAAREEARRRWEARDERRG